MEVKKDSYIPALRVSTEFAERVKIACEKLHLHPPQIRRELYEEIVRVWDGRQSIVRPAKILTEEMITDLSEGVITPEKIREIFPFSKRRAGVGFAWATVAAIAAIELFAGNLEIANRNVSDRLSLAHVPAQALTLSTPSPTPFEFPNITPPDAVTPSVSTPKLPEPEFSSPRIAKETPKPIANHPMHPQYARTKGGAVYLAGHALAATEKRLDAQIARIDREMTHTSGYASEKMQAAKKYLEQKLRDVQEERKHREADARIAWDKYHDVGSLTDSLRATLGL